MFRSRPKLSPEQLRKRKKWRRIRLGALLLTYAMIALFGGCADRALLYPTTDPISAPGATRVEIAVPNATPVEGYRLVVERPPTLVEISSASQPASLEPLPPSTQPTEPTEPTASTQPTDAVDGYVLILDGNGGRAESAVFWGHAVSGRRRIEVLSINYPGYGGSPGPAKLKSLAPAALAAYDAVAARAGGKPVVIWGASMGSTAALHVARERPVAGLVLTNPPPLKQLILRRYGWWNLWLAAGPIALAVPDELNSLENAAHVKCPAVFVSSQADGIVPPPYQQMVVDAYAGPKKHVRVPDAGHNDPPSGDSQKQFRNDVEWLWSGGK